MTRTKRESVRSAGPTVLVAVGVCLGLVFADADASAFCRSSTCRSTDSHSCELDDNGCPAEGAKLFWPTSCVSYATNKLGTSQLDPDETRIVIRKAFQTWSDVTCPDGTTASMTFQEREPVSCHKSQYNPNRPNVNVIVFQDNTWKYRSLDATLAKTSVTYSDQTGEIFDADIEINTAFNEMTITDDPTKVETDLQAVVTHEVGHFIGLAHAPDPQAVMYASYPPHSTSQRYLTADDIAAVCSVYPANNGLVCNTEPRNGFSESCDDPVKAPQCSTQPTSTSTASGALALVGGFGIVGMRARRRSGKTQSGVER
jgi:MYXO-CTERM domain-containing protein